MTFADLETVAFLNERFIPVWVDFGSSADAPLAEFTPEQLAPYADGGGAGALTSFFALADGRLIHELQGWAKPQKFRAEATFALGLTAENAAEKRIGHPALQSPLLAPLADAVKAARQVGVT